MYYFGKDFTSETEIQSLLEDYLKKKKVKDDVECHNIQKEQKLQTILY